MVYYILEDKVHRQDKAGQGFKQEPREGNLEAMAECCPTDPLSMAPSGLFSYTTQ